MTKKVIFVAGTRFSGSTFLDMIIGNDPYGFSGGEIRPLFYPYRRHHFDPKCGCGDTNCDIWPTIRSLGVSRLYNNIFDKHPNVEFIIDSSKNPFWIMEQSKRLAATDIQVKNVLIWKTPLEFAFSYKKRNLERWKEEWIAYHRTYFSIVDEFMPIKYSDFVDDKSVLSRLCDYLGIPCFPDKTEYWNKRHHVLFGNNSAKIHLYQKNNENYQKIAKNLPKEYDSDHRAGLKIDHQNISYQKIDDSELVNDVQMQVNSSTFIKDTLELLTAGNLGGPVKMHQRQLNHSHAVLYLKLLKYKIKNARTNNF